MKGLRKHTRERCQVAMQLFSYLLERDFQSLLQVVPFAWRQESTNSTRTVLTEPNSIEKIPPTVVIQLHQYSLYRATALNTVRIEVEGMQNIDMRI